MKIHKDMIIFELLQACPSAAKVLEEHGLKCSECMAVITESLEKGALRHGLVLQVVLEALQKEVDLQVPE